MKNTILVIFLGLLFMLAANANNSYVRSHISYQETIEGKACIIVENSKGIGVSCNWNQE